MKMSFKANSWGRYGQEAPGAITALIRIGEHYPRVALISKFSVKKFSIASTHVVVDQKTCRMNVKQLRDYVMYLKRMIHTLQQTARSSS